MHPATTRSTAVVQSTSSTVDDDDDGFCRQRDRLAVANVAKSRVRDKVPGASTPVFCRYPHFLTAQCGIGERKPSCQNPARSVQSFRHNTGLVTDGRTDRRTNISRRFIIIIIIITDYDSKYCASTASRGKKRTRCACKVFGRV